MTEEQYARHGISPRRAFQTVKTQESARGPQPFRFLIVTGGVYAERGRFLLIQTFDPADV